MDTTKLDEGHRELAALARAGGFGPPPPGEWTAEQVLAHVACADTAIASTGFMGSVLRRRASGPATTTGPRSTW
jgi:hypothetical protein